MPRGDKRKGRAVGEVIGELVGRGYILNVFAVFLVRFLLEVLVIFFVMKCDGIL